MSSYRESRRFVVVRQECLNGMTFHANSTHVSDSLIRYQIHYAAKTYRVVNLKDLNSNRIFYKDSTRIISTMKTCLYLCCLMVNYVAADNLIELATQLGAKKLVQLVNETGLANVLATTGNNTFVDR